MINRKAVLISTLFVIVMVAMAIWRLSLLPDWTLFTYTGVGATRHHNYWTGLFQPPSWLILFMGILAISGWNKHGPREAVDAWRNWYSFLLISFGVIVTAIEFLTIGRSLGVTANLDPIAVDRAEIALLGLLIMATGNHLPKLPWLQSRIALLRLTPVQGENYLRVRGRLTVATGIAVVISASVMSVKFVFPAIAAVTFGCIGIGIFCRAQLRRQPVH
jgi:hypothetical protein